MIFNIVFGILIIWLIAAFIYPCEKDEKSLEDRASTKGWLLLLLVLMAIISKFN